MDKKIWILLFVGLCYCISSSNAQDRGSMAFDDSYFEPLEDEYNIDQREEYESNDYAINGREFEDEPEMEDDFPLREFEDEGAANYDEQMEEEIDRRAEEEDSCVALAKGKKNSCETDVKSIKGGEDTKDRFILNRKAQTFTDLAKEGIKRQIVHFDYKRDLVAVALKRRKVCMLYKLPPIMKKSGGAFKDTAKKMAAFSKNSGKDRSSVWKKARWLATRYRARFQFTDEAVNTTALGTTINDKVCKGLKMNWMKIAKPSRSQTKAKLQRQQKDMDPSHGNDEAMLEERALARTRSICRVFFVKRESRMIYYSCGIWYSRICSKPGQVLLYTLRCS